MKLKGTWWWVIVALLMGASGEAYAATVTMYSSCKDIIMEGKIGCCEYDKLSPGERIALMREITQRGLSRMGLIAESKGVTVNDKNVAGIEATLWTSAGEGARIAQVGIRQKQVIFSYGKCGG